ncbi:unnamed protein product, partial [Adineta steineri]
HWSIGSAALIVNGKFRDEHLHLGLFGWYNSWCIGFFEFWIMMNYGLPAAMCSHAFYDFIIFFMYYIHGIICRQRKSHYITKTSTSYPNLKETFQSANENNDEESTVSRAKSIMFKRLYSEELWIFALHTSNVYGTHLKIFLNFANGHLTEEKKFSIGYTTVKISTGDMNNDKKVDVITTDFLTRAITILYNTGNETFDDRTIIPLDEEANILDVADINGDNQLDIIVAYSDKNFITILFNMGNGTFLNETTYETDYVIHTFEINDINNDNISDIIIGHLDGNISIHLNKGNGTFIQQMVYLTYRTVYSLLLSDMNNDNKVDIIFSTDSGNFEVLFNTGTETFYHRVISTNLYGANVRAISDINNDKIPDVIMTNYSPGEIGVYFNIGNGTFTNETIFPERFLPMEIKLLDINADGRMEIITIGENGRDGVIAMLLFYC